jgi:hypothetical protein
MSLNVDALNPCLELQKEIVKGLNNLNTMRYAMGPMKDSMEDITNTGHVIDVNLTNRVNDNLIAGLDTSLNNMDSLDSSITSLTGSCLNAVMGPLTALAKNASSGTGSLMGAAAGVADISDLIDTFGTMTQETFDTAFSPILTILNRFANMQSIVTSLGIEKALASLDEMLGCLSDSSCGTLVDAGTIDGYFLEISNFTAEFVLTDTGGIDLANVLDAAGIGGVAATDIDTNANTLQSYTTAISMKAKNLVASTSSSLIPDNFF